MGKSKDTRRVEANQAMAVCHSIRTSPRKLNLVAQTIRGLNAEKAVAEHSFSKKRIANCAAKSNACKPATRRAFSPQAVTAISWRYNAPTAPASGATPSAAKPANCPAAILPPISLPAPPATPTTLPPTPSPWSCGVGESGRIASIPSPFVKLFVISHRAAAEKHESS